MRMGTVAFARMQRVRNLNHTARSPASRRWHKLGKIYKEANTPVKVFISSSSQPTMKFAKFFLIASAAVMASPVHQADKRLDVSSVIDEIEAALPSATVNVTEVATVVSDVAQVLSTIIADAEAVASAAGIDYNTLLADAGVAVISQVTGVDLDAAEVAAVLTAVEKLVADLAAASSTLLTVATTSSA